jgi:hypothetical protein
MEGNLFTRHRHTWEHDDKTDPQGVQWQGVEWIHIGQDRGQWQALVNMGMNIWFHERQGLF